MTQAIKLNSANIQTLVTSYEELARMKALEYEVLQEPFGSPVLVTTAHLQESLFINKEVLDIYVKRAIKTLEDRITSMGGSLE
jgi:hypothetical protein